MKLESGYLVFSDVTTPTGAKLVMETLAETVLPREIYYFTRCDGNDEEGATIAFRRRQP